jgi:hypothetical protein
MLMSKVLKQKEKQQEHDFRSQWEYTPSLPKEVEKAAYETATGMTQDLTAELTDQIIGSYQTCINEQQKDWMKRLAQDSVQYLADRRGVRQRRVREDAFMNQEAAYLVQRIYSVLRNFSVDYNGQIGWTELFVTCTKPSIVTEVTRYNILREPIESVTNLRARFSTALWSIVIRAQKDKVEFLLVPASKTIGLTKAESQYVPVLTIDGKLEHNQVNWTINGRQFDNHELDAGLMDLFGELISLSRAQIQDSEAA